MRGAEEEYAADDPSALVCIAEVYDEKSLREHTEIVEVMVMADPMVTYSTLAEAVSYTVVTDSEANTVIVAGQISLDAAACLRCW